MRCRDCDVTWATLDPCWVCEQEGEYGTTFAGVGPLESEFDPAEIYGAWAGLF